MHLFKSIFFFLSLFFASFLSGYDVLVSVAPHRYFVEKIADNTVSVGLMVPAGASSHTYEPTPHQMIEASEAQIWFQIGESFETRAGKALLSYNPNLKIVNLQKGLDLIFEHSCCHHHAGSVDPHFWLSVRQAKIQAQTIAETLIANYPEHQSLYEENLRKFINELSDLDKKISVILNPMTPRLILVSHPAYAYFCRDYDLQQLSVEFEGKDPTPQQLTNLLQKATRNHLNKVFVQPQYGNKGAKLVAEQLHAKVIVLDPYSEHYISTMMEIAQAFAAP